MHNLGNLIRSSNKILIFTGAGMSTESGIADYRSKGGLWQRYQPITIQAFIEDEQARKTYWQRKKELFAQILQAQPHPGHTAILRLQQQGKLLGVITQNIDGLHQKSGIAKVLEIHGTNLETICLSCGEVRAFERVYAELLKSIEVPLCHCGGLLKANTISFGEELNPRVLQDAIRWTRECEILITAGSTLIVQPAASLPLYAKESGAKLILINRDETPLDAIADAVIREPISQALSQLIQSN